MRHESASIPELLSPAGSPAALRAAVVNGADAVYLGADRFNARRGADNFTVETLAEACEFAHLRGARIYLTANVVILPNEMGEALDLVDRAWAAGIDAVIVQDTGLLRCLAAELPDVRVHASTQLNCHSASSVAALAQLGVKRVTLSRETSLPEIADLVAAGRSVGVEIESFVHGALCMCYSGQCLLSSLIGGRSANRGMCAQPCRLKYELLDAMGREVAVPGAHLLSPKDLAGIGALPELIEARVASLKIEGRMKSAEYVAIVTGVYRSALDRAAQAPDAFAVRDGEMAVLSEAFSRGFSEAYLRGERGNEMMSYQRPNNRGVLAGRIVGVKGDTAQVSLETAVASGDLIEVWTGRGRFTQEIGPLVVEGHERGSAPAGAKVAVRLAEPAQAGDRVFRVRNAELLSAAARTFSEPDAAPVTVDVEVRVVVREPLRVVVTAGNVSASASGNVVEPARTKAVSAEEVREHVGRFGGTGFAAGEWDITLSPGAGIGFSELHRVRREALDVLKKRLLAPWAGRATRSPGLPRLSRRSSQTSRPTLVAVVSNAKVAARCLEAGADRVHLPAAEHTVDADPRIVPVLSRIAHDRDEARELTAVAPGAGAVAGTLGLLRRAHAVEAAVEAHWSLNVTNAHAAAALAELGAAFVWLSPELSGRQVASVVAQSPVPVGVAVMGRQELMVTEHCILMAAGPCGQRCSSCERRAGRHVLRDRKGYEFPVVTDAFGRSHVYNSVPLDLSGSFAEVLSTGVSAVRLDLETEDAEQAAAHVRRVRRALEGGPVAREEGTTTGHFFRGVS